MLSDEDLKNIKSVANNPFMGRHCPPIARAVLFLLEANEKKMASDPEPEPETKSVAREINEHLRGTKNFPLQRRVRALREMLRDVPDDESWELFRLLDQVDSWISDGRSWLENV